MINNTVIEVASQREFLIETCKRILESYQESIEARGFFTFVLSGGRTPKLIFEELLNTYSTKFDWSKVHFFWLDERCVPSSHMDSNFKLAYDCLISKLDEVGSINRMEGELDPEIASQNYKSTILNFFKGKQVAFDFVLLGMGEDGHIASIFPGTKEETVRSDEIVLATENSHNGYRRISLGLKVIQNCRTKLLLVNSLKKILTLKKERKLYPVHKITGMTVLIK